MQLYVIASIFIFLFQNAVSAVGNYQPRKEYFRVEKNKKIRIGNLTVVGRMSENQCAVFCVTFSDRCCEITYINPTKECKLDQSGCCHTDFVNSSGSNILHPRRTYVDYNQILSVTNGGSLGDWANEEFCTKGHYAIGYRMKIEGLHADRTELNAIEIICGSSSGEHCGDTASSDQRQWGKWTMEALCPAKTFLTEFSLQVDQYYAYKGSTGANYVRFRCRYFKDEYFEFDLSVSPGHGTYGSYGEWSEACPANSAICGITSDNNFYAPTYGDFDPRCDLNDYAWDTKFPHPILPNEAKPRYHVGPAAIPEEPLPLGYKTGKEPAPKPCEGKRTIDAFNDNNWYKTLEKLLDEDWY